MVLPDAADVAARSSDHGRTWERVGEVGGRPAVIVAHEGELYVALHTNEVKVSRDGGRAWKLRGAS